MVVQFRALFMASVLLGVRANHAAKNEITPVGIAVNKKRMLSNFPGSPVSIPGAMFSMIKDDKN